MNPTFFIQIGIIILLILFIFQLLKCFPISNLQTITCDNQQIEHFEERMGGIYDNGDYKELYDSEFVDIYETVYRDNTDVKIWINEMINKCLKNMNDTSKINILVGGCGVNKTGAYLKKKYDNVVCVDSSQNMLLKAQQIHPQCKYIWGDLRNPKLFHKHEFTHIFLDERTLYYHKKPDMKKIIRNCQLWLKPQGFIISPIYMNDYLGCAARYYSTNYLDNEKNLHGFTYLNHFHHDCYYLKNNTKDDDKYHYEYFDKIVLEDGKKRITKMDFYMFPKDEVYQLFYQNGFKIFSILPYEKGKQLVGGYELAILRKNKNKMNVDEIEHFTSTIQK